MGFQSYEGGQTHRQRTFFSKRDFIQFSIFVQFFQVLKDLEYFSHGICNSPFCNYIFEFRVFEQEFEFSTVCKRGIESYYFYSFLLLEEGMGRERFLLWKFSEWKNLKMYHLLYPFCLLDSISILALLSKKAWWVEDNKLIHHTIRKLDTALQWLLLQRPTGVRSLKA